MFPGLDPQSCSGRPRVADRGCPFDEACMVIIRKPQSWTLNVKDHFNRF